MGGALLHHPPPTGSVFRLCNGDVEARRVMPCPRVVYMPPHSWGAAIIGLELLVASWPSRRSSQPWGPGGLMP